MTDKGEVLFVKMWPGVENLASNDTDRTFMQLGPLLLSGVCERLAPFAGPLECLVSTYEKIILIVMKLERLHLALSISRADADVVPEVIDHLQALKAGRSG